MATDGTVDHVAKLAGLLQSAEELQSQRQKSIEVHKDVEPTLDVGNLLLLDHQPVDGDSLKRHLEVNLAALARNNAQMLLNEIWKLPVERVEDAVVAKLPDPATVLPREKPIPKAKPPTKWEQYAKNKSIQSKKRGRMIWDEQAKSWKPRFGYKRVDDDKAKWLMEVPGNADPYEDQFEKVKKAKQEKVAKNELQRLRNIARNSKTGKGSLLSTELKPSSQKDKDRLGLEIDVAKSSTASIGKFQKKLPDEKKTKGKGTRRKFESVTGNSKDEKQRSLDVWKKVYKPDAVNINKAVGTHMVAKERKSKGKRGTAKVKNRHGKDKKGSTKRLGGNKGGKGKKK